MRSSPAAPSAVGGERLGQLGLGNTNTSATTRTPPSTSTSAPPQPPSPQVQPHVASAHRRGRSLLGCNSARATRPRQHQHHRRQRDPHRQRQPRHHRHRVSAGGSTPVPCSPAAPCAVGAAATPGNPACTPRSIGDDEIPTANVNLGSPAVAITAGGTPTARCSPPERSAAGARANSAPTGSATPPTSVTTKYRPRTSSSAARTTVTVRQRHFVRPTDRWSGPLLGRQRQRPARPWPARQDRRRRKSRP